MVAEKELFLNDHKTADAVTSLLQAVKINAESRERVDIHNAASGDFALNIEPSDNDNAAQQDADFSEDEEAAINYEKSMPVFKTGLMNKTKFITRFQQNFALTSEVIEDKKVEEVKAARKPVDNPFARLMTMRTALTEKKNHASPGQRAVHKLPKKKRAPTLVGALRQISKFYRNMYCDRDYMAHKAFTKTLRYMDLLEERLMNEQYEFLAKKFAMLSIEDDAEEKCDEDDDKADEDPSSY